MMKFFITITFIVAFLAGANAYGKAENDTVYVSTKTTSYIYFPDSVIFYDCILTRTITINGVEGKKVQAEKRGGNLLYLFSNVASFESSSILVETLSAQYIFTLVHRENPEQIVYHFNPHQATKIKSKMVTPPAVQVATPIAQNVVKNEPVPNVVAATTNIPATVIPSTSAPIDMAEKCEAIKEMKMDDYINGIYDEKIKMALTDIFTDDQYMYFSVYIANEANVLYSINTIDFFTRQKSKIKKETQQITNLIPLYPDQNGIEGKKIKKGKPIRLVFVFEKFTILKDEKLFIKLNEKGGNRDIQISIASKEIINAEVIF
ncbi:MAG: conjugative transposon protein TraN [Flammeovirgaceae bacterium]|nr:conjugative transposon protein TraN [Flammeovirgaceae bacterium]